MTVDRDQTVFVAELVVHPVLFHGFNIYVCLIHFYSYCQNKMFLMYACLYSKSLGHPK
jgi:hypothetical protein